MEFLDYCARAREYALSMHDPIIVHHYDADGLASGAIVASAFLNENKKFRRLCIKKLDDEVIEKLKNDNEKEIIFVDLGSGNERVNELTENANIIIIDHHQPLKMNVKFHVNCMLFSLDGGMELSAASTAYLVFRNRVDLAVTGAVADQQAPFQGMNRYILEEGVAKDEVAIENDLCFYGRYARSLIQFLSLSDDPYIPGISYNEDRAVQLLNDLKIELKNGEHWRTYAELNKEEKTKLVNALVDILVSRGSYQKAEELICESYVFPKHEKNETYQASEFSTLLNACGRHNAHETGFGVCLNDKEALEKAKQLLTYHKQKIREGIEFALKNIRDFGKIYFLDARNVIDEGIIGVVCGIVLPFNAKKPIIGVSLGERDTIKFSGRANKKLIENGINLGETMKYACSKAGGVGGGHKIAAGASTPANKINEFLIFLGEKVRPMS